MLTESIRSPGRYLISVPRIDLMEEHVEFIKAKAIEQNLPVPELRLVHGKRSRQGTVRRQMSEAANDFATSSHVLVFVTHEGLRMSDLTPFAGWNARIDEVPDAVTSGSFAAGAAYRYLEPMYQLEGLETAHGGWWFRAAVSYT
jgi:hypothetical protein